MPQFVIAQRYEITGPGTFVLPVSENVQKYEFFSSSPIELGAEQSIVILPQGTPSIGMEYVIDWDANVTLADSATATINFGNIFILNGNSTAHATAELSSKKFTIRLFYDGSSWQRKFFVNLDESDIIPTNLLLDGAVKEAKIDDDQITISHLKSSDWTKGDLIVGDSSGDPFHLTAGTNNDILQLNASGEVSWATLSNDITIAAGGAVTIADNAVTLAKLNDFAARGGLITGATAGAPQEISLGSAGQVLFSDGTDAVWKSLTGDISIDSSGVVTSFGAVRTAKLTLTSAQILNINSVPQTIVAAPGSGYAIQVVGGSAFLDFNTTPYATDTSLYLKTAGATVGQWALSESILGVGADLFKPSPGGAVGTATQSSIVENAALQVTTNIADPTSGDSTLTIWVQYVLIEV